MTTTESRSYFELIFEHPSERSWLAGLTLLSGVLSLACILMGLHAAQYDFEAFSNPVRLLDLAGVDVASLRHFMVLDMFGYYLLLAPIIIASHRYLAQRTPWATLLTAAGLGYVLIGAIGASILAVAWPQAITAHAAANAAEALVIRGNFVLVTQLVYDGMWNLLEVLLAAIWWLGLGATLLRHEPRLGWLCLIAGIFPLLDGVAGIWALPALHELALTAYLVTGILWPLLMGVFLGRCAPPEPGV